MCVCVWGGALGWCVVCRGGGVIVIIDKRADAVFLVFSHQWILVSEQRASSSSS